jgi:hypothetical protein
MDKLVSNFGFNFNFRRYNGVQQLMLLISLVFSTASPIITAFAIVYFAMVGGYCSQALD